MYRCFFLSTLAGMFSLQLNVAWGSPENDRLWESTQESQAHGKSFAPVPCSSTTAITNPLALREAIERSLCHDPSLRQAISTAHFRSAQLGRKYAAFWPRLDGRGTQSWMHSNNNELAGGGRHSRTRAQSGALSLSWVLFDFGHRAAALESTHYLLTAAYADQNASIQRTLLDSAQLYFSVQAAARRSVAAEQVLILARENFAAATERHRAGAAALSDQIQAQTAYTQATLRRSREQGALASYQGKLALRMGLTADLPITVNITEQHLPTLGYLEHIEEFIDSANRSHPVLIASRARLAAAEATLAEVKAARLPTLTLTSDVSLTKSRILNGSERSFNRSDRVIGLQLSIPIFQGFEHTYQIKEAQAQASIGASELAVHKQRIAMEVWENYANLKTESEALILTQQLAEQSRKAMEIMRGRYQAGVGNMTDVLNAMNVYAGARDEYIEAAKNWELSKFGLAGSLGRLGFWDLDTY